MKTATVKELKKELSGLSQSELQGLCLRLSKFKKENKELLSYLLFEASDEAGYIEKIKTKIDSQFKEINFSSYYYIKKSVRRILREVKKYIRYSNHKETEVELLIYFCSKLLKIKPPIDGNSVLSNLYKRQNELIRKKISGLHEDLQYDYELELNRMDE